MPKGSRAEVLYPFEAEQDGEISVAQGERVRISTLDAPEGWVIAARALAPSEAGLVPAAYVKEVQEAAALSRMLFAVPEHGASTALPNIGEVASAVARTAAAQAPSTTIFTMPRR